MATKSKKPMNKTLHNNRFVKALAILLSCLFFFEMAFLAEKLFLEYRAGYLEDNQSYAYDGTELGYLESTSARTELSSTGGKLLRLATVYVSDEDMADGTSFKEKKKELEQNYKEELSRRILEIKKDKINDFSEILPGEGDASGTYRYRYDIQYNEEDILTDFTVQDQEWADSQNNGVTTVDGKDYYRGYPLDKIKLSDDEKEEIENEIESERKSELLTAEIDFQQEYTNLKTELDALKNYQYFIINKKTEQIYTNMDVKTIEDAVKKGGFSEFAFSVVDSKMKLSDVAYGLLSGVNNFYNSEEVDESYSVSSEQLSSDLSTAGYSFLLNLDPEVYDAYVHLNCKKDTMVKGDNFYNIYRNYTEANSNFTLSVVFLIVCGILWLIAVVFLALTAGRVKEDGTVELNWLDRMPIVIHMILSAVLVFLCVVGAKSLFEEMAYDDYLIATNTFLIRCAVALILALGNLVGVEWIMSLARNLRNHQFFRNSITYRLFDKNGKIRGRLRDLRKKIIPIKDKDVRLKLLLILAIYLIVICIFSSFGWMLGTLLNLIVSLTLLVYLSHFFKDLQKIYDGLAKAEEGKYDYDMKLDEMTDALRPIGEKVGNLTHGVEIAVEDAMKQEHTKTELITNVSHDLKTPLTSIITYTDLLKKCDIPNPDAQKYIAVLDEKSNRLKALVDNLVEASKATSGNMDVHAVELNLSSMITQVYGEYEDSILAKGLELKYRVPEQPIMVMADGQLTYRILENLFSNIQKYALERTRVYLDLSAETIEGKKYGSVTLKNISRNELNIDVAHLTERFVRGDDSRSSEGSGLGLSIAESLTGLQGGIFELGIDGDLFRATVKLPLVEKPLSE